MLTPITIKDANAYVAVHHRHHKPSPGGLFAVAVSSDGSIVGVAIIGRPVARMRQDGWTCEVVRLCTDGTRNACSKLYAAAWRAARALGYQRIGTYTLPSEGGASLRAAGWKLIGETSGGSWHRTGRPRIDKAPLQGKFAWEQTCVT